jgi:hypothetical protein
MSTQNLYHIPRSTVQNGPKWKQPKCPSAEKGTNKIWAYPHPAGTTKHYLAVKKEWSTYGSVMVKTLTVYNLIPANKIN